jgi:prophage regulatory protein
MTNKLLRLPQVLDLVGVSRSQLYKLISQGRFPSQCHIGDRISVWVSSEVEAWIMDQIATREPLGEREAA